MTQINQRYHNVDLIHHLNHDLLKDVRWPGGNQLDMKSSSSMEVWTIYWWGETIVIVIIRKTALIYKNKKTVMFVIKMKACSNGVMVDAYRLSN